MTKYQMWENRHEEPWLRNIKDAIRTFFERRNYLPTEIRMPISIYNQIWPGNNSYQAKIIINGANCEIKVISGPAEVQGPHIIWLGPVQDNDQFAIQIQK